MRTRLLSCAALIALCSCGDATSPKIAGTYALVSVGGRALPMTTMVTSTDTIFADTIAVAWPEGFARDGRMDHRFLGITHQPQQFTESIRMDGGAVTFVPPSCGSQFIDCFYVARTARIKGDTLTIAFSNPAFRPQVYVRF